MKRYEKYKAVGLPWLKEVPEKWSVTKGKYVYSITTGNLDANNAVEDGLYPFFTCSYYPKKINHYDFDCEALLVAGNGIVGYTQYYNGKFNAYQRTYVLSDFKDVDPLYLKYYTQRLLPVYLENKYVGSVINFIVLNDIKMFDICIPTLIEQKQIANFLDWKISEIDKLIELEKSKIEKLEEYKRSFAEYLVYKNNEKQTHKIMLSQCTHEQKISNKNIQHQNLLSLSYGKIVRKSIDSTSGLLPESFDNYQIVNDGNIILRLTDLQNDQRSLRVGLAKETGIITSAYVCLKTEQNIIPEYLYLHLHAFDLKKGFYGMGAGVRQSLNYKEIKKLPINISSLEEQKKIVNKYNEVSSRIELSKKEVQNQITYLEELKQTLISDVVTGKIDVRDIEIPKKYKKGE